MRLLVRNPRFRRLLLGDAVSSFGDSALFLSLAIWAKDLTGSAAAAGIVFLCITAPGLVSPLYGHLVDRVRRKPLLMAMYAAMAVIVPALLLVRTAGDIWIIYAVALAYGVLFSTPAYGGLLKDLLPSADAAAARSMLITVREGLRVLSPAAGAWIYLTFGGGTLAVVDAITFVVALLVLASIDVVESAPEPARAGDGFWNAVTAGFRYLRDVPLLLRLSVAFAAFLAGAGLLDTATFAAIEGLGRPAAFFGVVTAVQGAGSVLGGLLSGRLIARLAETRTTAVGYAVMALGVGLCLVEAVPVYLLGTALLGAGLPLLRVALGTAQQLYVPARLQGRVGAAIGMVSDLTQTLSIALGAAVVGLLDYRVMLGAVALAALLCCLVVLVRPAPTPAIVPSIADTPQPVG
ncbi:MFS transporter [Nonomuraea sp. NPDC003804]|uniref:MFS transporter n=1 Tax=Nonomuraea sp. NPDC003804 TaxID=3154547 RepID=UPI0033B61178